VVVAVLCCNPPTPRREWEQRRTIPGRPSKIFSRTHLLRGFDRAPRPIAQYFCLDCREAFQL